MTETRPKYQTDDDLELESRFMDAICQRWKCRAVKLPERKFNIDYFILGTPSEHGVVSNLMEPIRPKSFTGFVEIRTRNTYKEQYSTMMFSLSKWKDMHLYAQSGQKVFFAVWWRSSLGPSGKGEAGYIEIHKGVRHHLEWGGRGKDTARDPLDIEPMVHVPISEFKDVKIIPDYY